MVEPTMQSLKSNLSFHPRDTEPSDNRGVCDTDWLPYGVNVKLTDSLSVKSSLLIASKLNHTFGMIGAIASNWDKINKKDKNLIYEELRADDEFRMMIQLVEDNFPL